MFGFSGRSKFSRVLRSFRGGSASLVGMKRRRDTQSEAGNAKKRVTHDTFLKWKRDLNCKCQTMTWLDCETGMESGKKIVEKLKCKVCTEFVDKIGDGHSPDITKMANKNPLLLATQLPILILNSGGVY